MSSVFVLRGVQPANGNATFVELTRMAWCPGSSSTLIAKPVPNYTRLTRDCT